MDRRPRRPKAKGPFKHPKRESGCTRRAFDLSDEHYSMICRYGKGVAITGLRGILEDFSQQIRVRLGELTIETEQEREEAIICELTD